MPHPILSSDTLAAENPFPVVSPGATARSARSSLSGAIHAEWIKLWSLRSTWIILAFVFAAGMPIIWAVARFSSDEATTIASTWFYWTAVSAVLASVVGVLVFTADVQHGVMPVTMTAQPARPVIVAAKVVVAAAIGSIFGMVSATAGILGALLASVPWGSAGDVAGGVPWAIAYTTLTALFGLGVGVLVRSTAFAIAGVLIWGYVIEGLLTFVLPADANRFLPFLAGDQMLAYGSPGITSDAAVLSRAEGGLVLGAYVLATLLAGAFSFSRRDAA